jgi:hypothetical protein
VPAKVAVPSPLSTKVTPAGSAPDSDNVGLGDPVVATVNDPAEATKKVVVLALVIVGAAPAFTVSMKFWVALGDTVFAAVMVNG